MSDNTPPCIPVKCPWCKVVSPSNNCPCPEATRLRDILNPLSFPTITEATLLQEGVNG